MNIQCYRDRYNGIRLIWWIETDVGVKMVLRGWLTSVGSQSRTTPAGGSGSQGRGGLCSCSLLNAWESPAPESARHTGHTGISRLRCDILETAVLKSITRWQKENASEQVSGEACLFPLTTCFMHQIFLAYAKVKHWIVELKPKILGFLCSQSTNVGSRYLSKYWEDPHNSNECCHSLWRETYNLGGESRLRHSGTGG